MSRLWACLPAFELGRALAGRVDGKISYIGVTEEDRAAGYDRRRGFEAGLRAAGAVLDPSQPLLRGTLPGFRISVTMS